MGSIIDYVPLYAIYGLLTDSSRTKRYRILNDISKLIDNPNGVYVLNKYLFIQNMKRIIFYKSIDGNKVMSLQKIQQNGSTSFLLYLHGIIISFYRNPLMSITDNHHRFIISNVYTKEQKSVHAFLAIDVDENKIFKVTMTENNGFRLKRLKRIEKSIKLLKCSKYDKIKKVMSMEHPWFTIWWFLFESGRLIRVLKSENGRLIRYYSFREIVGLFDDIVVGKDHALLIDNKQELWFTGNNMHNKCGLINTVNDWTHGVIPDIVKHKGLNGKKVKSIHCGVNSSCVILDDGSCYLFGSLQSTNGDILNLSGICAPNDDNNDICSTFCDLNIIDASCGDSHIILMDDAMNIYGIGSNTKHQISALNNKMFFDELFLIEPNEVNILWKQHKIVKVIAVEDNSYFITSIHY